MVADMSALIILSQSSVGTFERKRRRRDVLASRDSVHDHLVKNYEVIYVGFIYRGAVVCGQIISYSSYLALSFLMLR
jgi:hypothetical protein